MRRIEPSYLVILEPTSAGFHSSILFHVSLDPKFSRTAALLLAIKVEVGERTGSCEVFILPNKEYIKK